MKYSGKTGSTIRETLRTLSAKEQESVAGGAGKADLVNGIVDRD